MGLNFRKSSDSVCLKVPIDKKEKVEFVVKNIDVVIALIDKVAQKEYEYFQTEKPCKYRENGIEIMTCKCALKLGNEEIKTFEQCRECKYRE